MLTQKLVHHWVYWKTPRSEEVTSKASIRINEDEDERSEKELQET